MVGNRLKSWRCQDSSPYTHKRLDTKKSYVRVMQATALLEGSRQSKDSEGKILESAHTYVHMIEYCNTATLNIFSP